MVAYFALLSFVPLDLPRTLAARPRAPRRRIGLPRQGAAPRSPAPRSRASSSSSTRCRTTRRRSESSAASRCSGRRCRSSARSSRRSTSSTAGRTARSCTGRARRRRDGRDDHDALHQARRRRARRRSAEARTRRDSSGTASSRTSSRSRSRCSASSCSCSRSTGVLTNAPTYVTRRAARRDLRGDLLEASFQIVPVFVRLAGVNPTLRVLGGPAILLLWLYVMANVIVFGAELNWWRSERARLRSTEPVARGPRVARAPSARGASAAPSRRRRARRRSAARRRERRPGRSRSLRCRAARRRSRPRRCPCRAARRRRARSRRARDVARTAVLDALSSPSSFAIAGAPSRRVARGVQPGPAAERGDLDAGVLADRPAADARSKPNARLERARSRSTSSPVSSG